MSSLTRQVMQLQGQWEQRLEESSQAKVVKSSPLGKRRFPTSLTPLRASGPGLCPGRVGHGILGLCPDPLHVPKTIHTASETNGMGPPEGGPQEAQLRKEVAALREQLEQAHSHR